MDEPISRVSRRTAIATLAGGGTVAAAIAAPSLAPGGSALTSFKQAFSSPFLALDRAGDATWAAEVGSTLQVQNGPRLRISSVETGSSYGRHAGLIRSRSFLVNFEVLGGRVRSDAIHRVTHARYGSFDLLLKTTAATPGFAQAAFS